MINDIIRKLNSYLSFWIRDNKPVNRSKDKLIKKYLTRKELDQLFNLQYHTKNVNYIFSRVFKS